MLLRHRVTWWKCLVVFSTLSFYITYNLTNLLDVILGHVMHMYNTPLWCPALNTYRNLANLKQVSHGIFVVVTANEGLAGTSSTKPSFVVSWPVAQKRPIKEIRNKIRERGIGSAG